MSHIKKTAVASGMSGPSGLLQSDLHADASGDSAGPDQAGQYQAKSSNNHGDANLCASPRQLYIVQWLNTSQAGKA
jgi:hypothetical protein